MNLGYIYLLSFFALIVCSLFISILGASILRNWHFSWRSIIICALPTWLVLGFFSLDTFHQPLFVAWHQKQNTALPREGCLIYRPSFGHLYAIYTMDREKFSSWVTRHPWKLHPGNNDLLFADGPVLGCSAPELNYETEMAPNGGQLRVYYETGKMFVSYNVM